MKSILVPTDFSNTSCMAHEYAKAVAKKFGCEIKAIHAYTIPQLETSIPTGIREALRARQVEAAEEQFKDFFCARPNQKSDEDVAVRIKEKYLVSEGYPAETICHFSEADDVDMIVMGTKGSHNLAEKVFGSVTTFVIEKCNKPVLVVPETATFDGIKNIAYATNYELGDEKFIEFLEMFSRNFEANTHFVHVNTKSSTLTPTGHDGGEHVHFDMGFVSFTEVAGDTVMKGLDNFIEKENIDVLAMFIPNRGFWDQLFHASLTKKMVFHSKVPLLIYHG